MERERSEEKPSVWGQVSGSVVLSWGGFVSQQCLGTFLMATAVCVQVQLSSGVEARDAASYSTTHREALHHEPPAPDASSSALNEVLLTAPQTFCPLSVGHHPKPGDPLPVT